MLIETVISRLEEFSSKARTGYIKPWKNTSIAMTLVALAERDDLTLTRIDNLIRGSYEMEGVDSFTIDETILAITDFLKIKEV